MSAALKNNRNLELIGFLLIALVIMVALPLMLDIFRLNLVGKYLTYAFVAIGLVLCWGQTGMSTPGIPAFMDWNKLTALPFFWVPFKWLPFALVAVIAVSTILAFILGAALFK